MKESAWAGGRGVSIRKGLDTAKLLQRLPFAARKITQRPKSK
jgi:hypothetical protein